MSLSGSQTKVPLMSRRANSRPDLSSASFSYSRSEMHGGGNVFPQEQMLPMDGSSTFFYRKSTVGRGHGGSSLQSVHQNVHFLQTQINDHLNKAEMLFQSGGAMEAEKCLTMASMKLEQLRDIAMDLHQMGQPSDSIMRSVDQFQERMDSTRFFQQRSSRGGGGGGGGGGGVTWDDPGRNFHEALAWIGQQKRLIETSPWGEDPATIEQQIISHNKFHSSIQRSIEMDRARAELDQKGDRALSKALEQEWDSLQKMSFSRTNQLRDLLKIIEEISKEIMWVNEREEEELVFDWGDKNIDTYIPRKQESYSKLMRDLEEKEKQLNKLNLKIDNLLKNNHPASDKIEAYKDTLQTQWSWLLQITKCIDVHLKENAAYSQFFKEANETYSKLQKEHEVIRKKFTCDKGTPLENLVELIKNLEREKEVILESKRQVQHLVSKSKSIVRLRPRNPEEKSTSPVIVKALCDFKQDQKQICKGNEGILKDNSQRSKWQVTGPGGLDMMIPSVCLQVPPPNPLSINLANKNEQYYEAIMGIWNQLYINIKSLISWQYCVKDINRINSLTISMLAKMRPEEYRNIIKSLETHYQEFQRNSLGSEMFVDDDKRKVEAQYSGAQTHYDKLIIQLPTYIAQTQKVETAKDIEVKVNNVQPVKTAPPQSSSQISSQTSSQTSSQSLTLLSELHALRQRLEQAESGLTRYLHLPLGENSVQECTQNLVLLEVIHQDIDVIRDEYLRLKERILRQLEGMTDADKAKFLRSELTLINQKLGSLEGSASIYIQRLKALQALMQSLLQAEDIIKVHEARLTEKETSSLDLREVEDYRATLKQMKTELDQKRDVLKKMELELGNAVRLNDKIDQSLHKCDVDLSRYAELVNQMSDRWRRIQTQIDSRTWDLEKQLQQLKHYKQTSSLLSNWIEDARQRQGALQAGKFSDIKVLTEHINQQKMLHSEIKGKKDKVEDVQRDADTCAASIKDYELQLASYSAGLETLLNIPIKRTMLQSPATVIRQEAADLQSQYIELLTRSGDYYKFLGEMLKNMEELKIRNTKIDVLEEELRRLKEEALERSQRNRSLEDTLGQYKLELSQSRQQLLSMEEVKQTQAMQVSAAKENLDSTYGQVKDLNEQVLRLTYQIEEEKRKRRLAEERYTSQRDEYESIVRKRQKELDELNRSKLDIEMTIKDKERDVERLRMQLEDETSRRQSSEAELSKTSGMLHQSQTHYNEVLQEKDSLLLRIKMMEQDKSRMQKSEDELARIKVSLESELRQKQRLQEEAEKIRRELNLLKSQYELKEGLLRQQDSDRDKAERERNSLKSEIERLMSELRSVEDRYKTRLLSCEREVSDLMSTREALERELLKLRQRPEAFHRQTQTDEGGDTVDAALLVFDGVHRKVSAHQLCDCGIIDKATLSRLLKGQKTVEEVAVDIQLNLKGTSVIAGVASGPQGKMPITEAKSKNLLSPESAIMLLEAQVATGHIIDPKFNDRMSVDAACSRGLVDTQDRDKLMTAEAASTGFKDPHTGKLLSAGQALKKGWIDRETTLRLLQAQESAGGILDPVLSVFLPKDVALDRKLIDEDLYRALNKRPACYIDPSTQQNACYSDLKMKCRVEPASGLLLLPAPEKPMTVPGLRGEVPISALVDSKLLSPSDVEKINQGTLTSKDIEDKLKIYLHGSSCIAGVYDEKNNRTLPIYQAMKEGLLRPGTTLELLEAQAASGFMIDPVNNLCLTVEEAWKRGLVGKEYKSKLLSAERAVTGYKDPRTGKIISLFQAIAKGVIEKGHGIRLLEAQIASGGIIDPKESHRIDVEVAYQRGYFDKEMNEILTYEGDDTKGFFDPNTQENLTYLQLKDRCIKDESTGLVLLPLWDKSKPRAMQQTSQKNTLRKRRVVIVDPDTGKEMTVREAYHRELIDYDTFLELSEQECEWEEITITASDGTTRVVIVDRKTGRQFDIQDALNKGIIEQSTLERYQLGAITLTEFADQILSKTTTGLSLTSTNAEDVATCSSPTQMAPSSPTARRRFASVSITLSPPSAVLDDQSPIAAVFDTETIEKITIPEALRRGIMDTITAQRLLEAQVCTGGIINPANGERLFLQDAVHQSIIDEDMANKLKPAQKAYLGFEDVKTKRKMSAAEAMKEKWLPYDAGQRFLEFQYLTGGLIEPETGRKVSIEEAISRGWLDGRGARKLQDTRNYAKNLTCPKTKLKISYKEALDNCMVEENNGMKMIQATSISSKGISSPYNVSNPGSRSGSRAGSRTGSRSGSRRGSVDLTSSFSYSFSSTGFSSRSSS
ncbi:desmoplakin-like isoform X2 [Megalops cyprinoides]|uniref:desmoplakin-like isoform X2 n=1 Tax=Megalops cyprinoides TaxID=118141 RepID=UPI001864601D|nr:desmoplakin-like isoform X2 [Megalops cyprinoides]